MRIARQIYLAMKQRRDYDVLDCFNEIDIYNSGFITPERLEEYLDSYKRISNRKICKFSLTNFSKNKKISFADFAHFLDRLDPLPYERNEILSISSIKASREKNIKEFEERSKNFDKEGKKKENRLKLPKSEPQVITVHIQQDNSKSNPFPYTKVRKLERYNLRDQKLKKRLVKDFKTDSRKLRSHHLKKEDQLLMQLIKTIEKMAEIEKENEGSRQNLAIRPDFKINQFFSFFCRSGFGIVSPLDLKLGLEELGIIPHKEDIFLLMKEYNIDSLGKLNFEDFKRMLCPLEKQYENLFENKKEKHNQRNFVVVRILFLSF